MTISPITSRINGQIGFSSKRNNNANGSQNSSSNGLRKMPVVALIAMTPLVYQNNMVGYAANPISPEHSLSVNNNGEKSRPDEISRDTVTSGYQKCEFIKYDTDYNNENAEKLGFRYSYLSEGGYRGILGGYFTSICSQQNPNKMYYATFYEHAGDKKSKNPKLVRVPESFGKYILNFTKSKDNNNAVYALPKSSYERVYGADSLKSAPVIEDVITTIVSSAGGKFPQEKPDDYWE